MAFHAHTRTMLVGFYSLMCITINWELPRCENVYSNPHHRVMIPLLNVIISTSSLLLLYISRKQVNNFDNGNHDNGMSRSV